jgi:broad specificity phosphatase PhoE
MPSIVLIRHGPVASKAPGLLSFWDFVRYCDDYELSGLAMGTSPPVGTTDVVRRAACVFASPAPRAVESARALGAGDRVVFDSCFREEPNLAPPLQGRWPLIVWFAASRASGAFHPAHAGARQEMQLRAEAAAHKLIRATNQGPTALVGHGWFNRAIARALTDAGWGSAKSRGYAMAFGRVAHPWGFSVFNRSKTLF